MIIEPNEPVGPAPPRPDGWMPAAPTAETGAVGTLVIGVDGRLLSIDAWAAGMLGAESADELRGTDVRRFFRHPEHLADTVRAIQLTGVLENWDGDFVTADGSALHAVVNLMGDFDESRTLVAIRASLYNITEWRRVHERKMLAQRFETIGRMAGGIAHDFNNLLTVISGHAECLALTPSADASVRRSVAAIRESAARGAALTQRLLAFGRRQVLLPRTVDPRELVLAVEGDLRRTFGRRIAVGVDLASDLSAVHVDAEQIERALGTVAAHAVDAMPRGGAITFRLRNVAVNGAWPQRHPFVVAEGRYLAIEAACAGLTLDATTQQKIFEPFQVRAGNAKDPWGLAAVFGLVKQSGGYIWLDADPAQVVFTILLPAVASTVAEPPAAPLEASPTILVVDDDDDVRGLVVSILKHQGYRVLDAASAEHGSRLCGTSDIDLLVSDVALGGVRGDEFAAALMRSRPGLKLVCMSGYPEPGAMRALDPRRAVFLEKPFSARQLTEHVGSLLRH